MRNKVKRLPIIICSSVIRSTKQGESHGGMFIVDLQNEVFNQVVDWNNESIDWQGRGADRGLRGIAFYNDKIICAASDEIFFYDKNFHIVKSFKNRYLKHCHEIHCHNNLLYLASTGFDSILVFDLVNEKFIKGFMYRRKSYWWHKKRYRSLILKKSRLLQAIVRSNDFIFRSFNPNKKRGPVRADTNHINNVFIYNNNIYFSGVRLENLIKINNDQESTTVLDTVGVGTHNVSICNDLLIYNDTRNDIISVRNIEDGQQVNIDIKKYNREELLNTDIPNDHARQGFGRGLCFNDEFLITGSSPSTISVYSINGKEIIKTINLSLDIRNAIHGLEIYPYEYNIGTLGKEY